MTCPQEPIPAGWKVWRGAVPTELTQLAMDVRDHVRQYTRGTIVQQLDYNGQTVGVFVSSHTWTYKGGQLVTGICIPGVSLLVQMPPSASAATPTPDPSTPDPSLAMWGADDVPLSAPLPPPQSTDWGLVGGCALAAGAVVAAFWAALSVSGKRRS